MVVFYFHCTKNKRTTAGLSTTTPPPPPQPQNNNLCCVLHHHRRRRCPTSPPASSSSAITTIHLKRLNNNIRDLSSPPIQSHNNIQHMNNIPPLASSVSYRTASWTTTNQPMHPLSPRTQNPGYMKENFVVCIESLHLGDVGDQKNVSVARDVSHSFVRSVYGSVLFPPY